MAVWCQSMGSGAQLRPPANAMPLRFLVIPSTSCWTLRKTGHSSERSDDDARPVWGVPNALRLSSSIAAMSRALRCLLRRRLRLGLEERDLPLEVLDLPRRLERAAEFRDPVAKRLGIGLRLYLLGERRNDSASHGAVLAGRRRRELDELEVLPAGVPGAEHCLEFRVGRGLGDVAVGEPGAEEVLDEQIPRRNLRGDRKSTRLNSSHS